MSAEHITVEWLDNGRDPQNPPSPDYPDGIALNMTSDDTEAACVVDLPYPAKRCGLYVLRCTLCGQSIAITTAGRADDPKSVRIACQIDEIPA